LFDFDGNAHGQYPYGSLIQASNGYLYGMTQGGAANNLGLIFSFDPNNSANPPVDLWDFTTLNNGGSYPQGSLMQASNGTSVWND